MKVLFITRKYPPQIGGMEQVSYGLISNFPDPKQSIILAKSQANLWWWLPYAVIAGIIKAWSVDLVHLGDGVLSPVGYLIKLCTRKPVVVTVHGLDVVYTRKIFKKINLPCLSKLDKLICISHQTYQECLKRGIEEKKLVIIPNGIAVSKFKVSGSGFKVQDKKILLTVGRLVKRKGVNWFVRKVMPKLSDQYVYMIIGQGSERSVIERSIQELHLESKVKLMGAVSDAQLGRFYAGADLFIMPNIKIEGDREGFGLVCLEAAALGLPVVASGIEGIKDAIQNGKNGWLVESGNPESFIQKIQELQANPDLPQLKEKIKQYTLDNYSWPKIIARYQEEFQKLI